MSDSMRDLEWIGEITEKPEELISVFRADILRGISLKAKAKAAEDDFKNYKTAADDILKPIFLALDVKSAGLTGMGTAMLKYGTNVTINREKLELALLSRGMGAGEIAEIVEASQNVKQYDYIEYKTWKEKKRKK